MGTLEEFPVEIEKNHQSVKQKSNVIRGPWPERNGSALENRPFSEIPAKDRPLNIAEGPWHKREATQEQALKIGKLREELKQFEDNEAKTGHPGGEHTEPEEDDGKRAIEGVLTRFTTCEVCGGSGRRWFVLRCTACDGHGSVPADSEKTVEYVGGPKTG